MTVLTNGQYEFVNGMGQSIIMGWGTAIRVLTVAGLLSQPTQKFIDSEWSGRTGGVFSDDDFFGARTLTFQLGLEDAATEDVELLLDRFHTVCRGAMATGVLNLKRPNKTQRSIFCRVRRAEFEANWDVKQGLALGGLELQCADPLFYQGDETTGRATIPIVTGGRTYLRHYPWTYGETIGEDNTISLYYIGNIEMAPILRIYGPCSNPQVIHIQQGKTIMANIALDADDVLELDLRLHTAVLNGVSHQRGSLDLRTRWWTLQEGQNDVRYIAGGGSAGSHVEMDWRPAFATA